MKTKRRQGGFTLPEIMIALALSSMAILCVSMTFIFGQKGIQAGVADFLLAKEMRMVRENIVRGLSNNGGLRSAAWSNMTVGAISGGRNSLFFSADTNAWAASSDTNVNFGFYANANGLNAYERLPGSISSNLLGGMVSSNITLTTMLFSSGGNMVTSQVSLSFSTAGKTCTRSQVITTRIPNP